MPLSFHQVFKKSSHSHILRIPCWLWFKFICDYSFPNMPPPLMNCYNSLLIGLSISSPVLLKPSFHLDNATITIVLVNELSMTFLPQPFKQYHPINKIRSLCWGLEVPILFDSWWTPSQTTSPSWLVSCDVSCLQMLFFFISKPLSTQLSLCETLVTWTFSRSVSSHLSKISLSTTLSGSSFADLDSPHYLL